MLGKTDPQGNFFDSCIEDYFLPEEHKLLQIKKKVDFSFIEEETGDLYVKAVGRNSYPPEVMFKILFLEFYYNLSDVEVVKQLKFNVLFRYFVELKNKDSIPDDTSLVVFRKRLGEERFETNLESILQKEDEKKLKSDALVCDALYNSLSNRLSIEKRKKKHYISEKREKKRLNDFIYSDKEDKLICRKGYSSIGKTRQENGYLYYFSSNSCRGCDRKRECSFNKDRARIYVSDSHLLYIKADPEEKKKALEKRKRIEAKFGEAKKHHRMARARYRGRCEDKVRLWQKSLL